MTVPVQLRRAKKTRDYKTPEEKVTRHNVSFTPEDQRLIAAIGARIGQSRLMPILRHALKSAAGLPKSSKTR